MQPKFDDQHHRLLPVTAQGYYALRHQIATVADMLRQVANGGPLSAVEAEEMWLYLTAAGCGLDAAWKDRQPNLRVAK